MAKYKKISKCCRAGCSFNETLQSWICWECGELCETVTIEE